MERRTFRIRIEGEEREMARWRRGIGDWLLASCLYNRQMIRIGEQR